jgi:hypothetical protein
MFPPKAVSNASYSRAASKPMQHTFRLSDRKCFRGLYCRCILTPLIFQTHRGIQRIIMNFDRGVGTFRQHGNVINVLLDFTGRRDPRDLEISRMPRDYAAKVKKFLKGFTVKLALGRDKTKTLCVSCCSSTIYPSKLADCALQ